MFPPYKSEMLSVIGEFPTMNKHNKNAKNDDYTMSAEMFSSLGFSPMILFGINSFIFMLRVQ